MPHDEQHGTPLVGGEAALVQLKTMIQMGFAENQRRLASLETKVESQAAGCPSCHDGLVAMINRSAAEGRVLVKEATKEVVAEMLIKHRDHETRIRSLEQGAWKLAGAGAVVGSVASALIMYALRWVFERLA